MADPDVQAALDLAWTQTHADVVPVTAAVEQGGWIYMDLRSGRLHIERKYNALGQPRGPGQNEEGAFNIDLNYPPVVPGSCVVAMFHTHPSFPFTGCSDYDLQLGEQFGVPGIVRGRDHHRDFHGIPRRSGFAEAAQHPRFPG
jgi:hypothetical protein